MEEILAQWESIKESTKPDEITYNGPVNDRMQLPCPTDAYVDQSDVGVYPFICSGGL